ncbi:FHA domain-containing protein [bacterium]|nr:FHA domain-containing protein [bacterium]
MIRLVMRDAEGGEASFPVVAEVTIGRSSECEVRVNDAAVSRKHARVSIDIEAGGGLVIEDLGSPNGTFVNGARIQGATPLNPGDTIQVVAQKIRVVETSPLEDYASTTRIDFKGAPRATAPGGAESGLSSARDAGLAIDENSLVSAAARAERLERAIRKQNPENKWNHTIAPGTYRNNTPIAPRAGGSNRSFLWIGLAVVAGIAVIIWLLAR